MLQSIWIEDGTGFKSYLFDPEAYRDATTSLELKWRILTGCSHRGYLAAHAGMLRRIAARLLLALVPPKYLALPAPSSRAPEAQTWPLEHSDYDDAWDREISAFGHWRKNTCAHDQALALLSDHNYISAMFALYAQGDPGYSRLVGRLVGRL